MIKTTLITAAMIAAVPALAQTGSTTTPTPPTSGSPAPMGPTAPGQSSTGQLPGSTTGQTASDPMTADTAQSADTAATAQTATSTDQIAQVVESQFATYDADADGALSSVEFGKWMTTLREANGAKASSSSKESKAWLKTAFTQADTDKSKSVSKAELTGFLAANKG